MKTTKTTKSTLAKTLIALCAAVLLLALMGCSSCSSCGDTQAETGERIATVEEQVAGIGLSVGDLKNTDSELKSYIDTLKQTVTALETEAQALDGRIAALESDTAAADVKEELLALKESTIRQAKALGESLATLEQKYKDANAADDAIGSDMDNLRVQIETLQLDAEAMELRLKTLEDDTEVETLKVVLDAMKAQTESRIKALQESIDALEQKYTALFGTDAALQSGIDSLKDSTLALQAGVKALDDRIKALEESTATADLKKQLEALKAETEESIKTLSDSIDALTEKDRALEEKIKTLENTVATLATKTWAEATFATIEQYNSLQSEIAGIKTEIASIDAAVEALESATAQEIAAIKATLATLVGKSELADEIAKITDAYLLAVQTAKDDVTTAYTAAIGAAIATSEEGMKTWVNTRLAENYYTVAQIDAKLKLLADADTGLGDTLKTQIDAQKAALETAKTELTAAYEAAIADAITNHQGLLDTQINNAISTATNGLQAQIDAIQKSIDTLSAEVAANKTSINNIIARLDELEKENIALLKCIAGNHEWDETKTAYAWAENTTLTCKARVECKHCGGIFDIEATTYTCALVSGENGASYYELTAAFDPNLRLTAQTKNITDATKFDRNQMEAAVTYMLDTVDSGESVTVKIKLQSGNLTQLEKIAECIDDQPSKQVTLELDSATADSQIGADAFAGCNLYALHLGENFTQIFTSAFISCKNLTEITLPAGLTEIGHYAFYGCSSLKSITVPAGVQNIAPSTFQGCTSLATVAFAENSKLEFLYNNAFYGCSALTSIRIPDSVTRIGDNVFGGCSALKEVTLPANIKFIGAEVFARAFELKTIICKGVLTKCDVNVFRDCPTDYITLYLAEGQKILSLDSTGQYTVDKVDDWFYGGDNDFCGARFKEYVTCFSFEATGDKSASRLKGEIEAQVSHGAFNITVNFASEFTEGTADDRFTAIKEAIGNAPEGSVTLTLSGVTSIPDNAFKGCTALKSIIILEDGTQTAGSD